MLDSITLTDMLITDWTQKHRILPISAYTLTATARILVHIGPAENKSFSSCMYSNGPINKWEYEPPF